MLNLGIAILLFIAGILFTMRFGFFQVTHAGMIFRHALKLLKKENRKTDGDGMSPFKALTTALAGSVGTGNIAGVAGAIIIGGSGAIFWMWISALFGMSTKYAEIVLALHYRGNGKYSGSTMDVIINGLGNKKYASALAYTFALCGTLASFASGNLVQINAISAALSSVLPSLSTAFVGLFFAVITMVVLLGGMQRIGKATSFLVPFMSIFYIIASLLIIIPNASKIPDVFSMIVHDAFSLSSAVGGIAGFSIVRAFRVGTMRGIFSNEAGIGSAPMAHACVPKSTNPVEQGMVGIFEVFVDTILICSLTAFAILLSGVIIPYGNSESMSVALTIDAFSTVFSRDTAAVFICICTVLFAFSSILGWSLYGMKCCAFVFSERSLPIYKVIFPLFLILGAILDSTLAWKIGETANALMAFPNLTALILLAPIVKKLTLCYTVRYDKQSKRKYNRNKKYTA